MQTQLQGRVVEQMQAYRTRKHRQSRLKTRYYLLTYFRAAFLFKLFSSHNITNKAIVYITTTKTINQHPTTCACEQSTDLALGKSERLDAWSRSRTRKYESRRCWQPPLFVFSQFTTELTIAGRKPCPISCGGNMPCIHVAITSVGVNKRFAFLLQ